MSNQQKDRDMQAQVDELAERYRQTHKAAIEDAVKHGTGFIHVSMDGMMTHHPFEETVQVIETIKQYGIRTNKEV